MEILKINIKKLLFFKEDKFDHFGFEIKTESIINFMRNINLEQGNDSVGVVSSSCYTNWRVQTKKAFHELFESLRKHFLFSKNQHELGYELTFSSENKSQGTIFLESDSKHTEKQALDSVETIEISKEECSLFMILFKSICPNCRD